jgi:hypothetical protein
MSVEKVLNDFWIDVIKQSKKNLKKKDKIASKALLNSLDYSVKVSKNSFETSFVMEDYGQFIDAGVKGVGGTKANGEKWKKKKVTNSRFKYKNKRPPTSALNGWTIRKGIAPRDKGGRFVTRKGILHAISNSIFHTGLETTNFFTQPFEKEFKQLPDDLVEAYGLTVDQLLKVSLA